MAEALQHLRSLHSDLFIKDHITDPQIEKINFTESELDHVLQLFTENPLPKKSEEQTLQFLERIATLDCQIGHPDAVRFKKWSDVYGDKFVSLQHIVDAKAEFIISCELKRNQKKSGLTDGDVKNWYTRWTHNGLSEIVSKIWSDQQQTYQTMEAAYEKEKINLDQLHITNVGAEQRLLIDINDIQIKWGDAESLLSEKRKRYSGIFNRKIAKNNPYYQDMQKLFSDKLRYPSETVLDWLHCFASVRTIGRELQAQAAKYITTVQYPVNDNIDIQES
jgi:hypothetical protein